MKCCRNESAGVERIHRPQVGCATIRARPIHLSVRHICRMPPGICYWRITVAITAEWRLKLAYIDLTTWVGNVRYVPDSIRIDQCSLTHRWFYHPKHACNQTQSVDKSFSTEMTSHKP